MKNKGLLLLLGIILLAGVVSLVWPKLYSERAPETGIVSKSFFEQYLVQEVFSGVSAPLGIESNPIGPKFKTRINEAYTGKPNFAGHYTLTTWGCGMGCIAFVVIDNKTGRIYGDYISERLTDGHPSYGIDFHLESSLIIVNPKEETSPDFLQSMDEHQKNFLKEGMGTYPTKYLKWEENNLIPVDQSNY
jgi:hypothetical protein